MPSSSRTSRKADTEIIGRRERKPEGKRGEGKKRGIIWRGRSRERRAPTTYSKRKGAESVEVMRTGEKEEYTE